MSTPDVAASELLEFGYVQEANRLFFHPLGLALGYDPVMDKLFVVDNRDDSEGMIFVPSELDTDDAVQKCARVELEGVKRFEARCRMAERECIEFVSGTASQTVPKAGPVIRTMVGSWLRQQREG